MQNKQKIIHFEIDPAEVNKNVKVDVAVLGDVKETIKEILPLIKSKIMTNGLMNFIIFIKLNMTR